MNEDLFENIARGACLHFTYEELLSLISDVINHVSFGK